MLAGTLFQVADCWLLIVPSVEKRWWERPLGPFIKALIPFARAPASWPNCLPKAPCPKAITLEFRFQHVNLVVQIQSIVVPHCSSPVSYSSVPACAYLPPYPAKSQGLIFQPCEHYNHSVSPSSLTFRLPSISLVPKLQLALAATLTRTPPKNTDGQFQSRFTDLLKEAHWR